ncbi:MAG TPA: Gldg family protein [Steroidobacteraceae bacterium]|nr:Gldg family protein [Steroidobacteraceae bacterium]
MNKRLTLGGGALLALALIFAGVTILLNQALRGWRIDLTQNHLYTTAPGTDRILKSLKQPINLYFYYSSGAADQLPQIKTYASRVRDLLEELAARSHGELHLHIVDPQPFSDDEDRATELGVRAVPVGASGQSLYFGLAGTNSTDGHAAIDFFDPSKEQFLEYDIMKVVYQLATTSKPVIGWLSSLPMEGSFDPATGQPRDPWVIFQEAQQLYTVRPLDAHVTRIDPDISVLVLVHPKNLSPATEYAIDQYALRGGHILAFVDPLAEQDTAGADPSNPMAALAADHSSHLEPLLSSWGVEFNPRQVIGDADHALTVTMREGGPPVRDIAILGLDSSSINHTDVITAGLSNLNVATAGYLQPKKGATVKFEPLLETSTLAAPIPAQRFVMLSDPSTLQDDFHPTGQRYTIAARITGDVPSAFPAGPPAGVQPIPGEPPLKASTKPLDLVVVADTDMLGDFLWVREQNLFGQRIVQPWANNGDFVSNALDNLSGSDDLISVRGRAAFTRPFTRVEQLRAEADERFRAKEQELEGELHQTEDKLTALQSSRNDKSALILTPQQEQELDHFQQEKLAIRKQLRAVRLSLDEDIDRLGDTLKIINIVVVPAAFAVIALLIGWRRRRRRLAPVAAPGPRGAAGPPHAPVTPVSVPHVRDPGAAGRGSP